VRILADAAVRGVHCDKPVNLAFGSRTSLLGLISKLGEILGRQPKLEFEPSRVGDVRDSQAANDRLRALFPGQVPVPLEEGLAQTVQWYQGRLEQNVLENAR
jgi:UDP-glucose 4-epimerase